MSAVINFLDARLPDRFWGKVAPCPMSGCWLWTNSLHSTGYAQFSIHDYPHRAHRVAYEALVGPIPQGLQIDHRCRVRCCVNPAHLEPVTHAENVRRGEAGILWYSRTHCARGHQLAGETCVIRTRANGKKYRVCLLCERALAAVKRARCR